MSGVRIKSLMGIGVVCLLTVMQSNGLELKGSNYIGATFDSYNWGDSSFEDALGRTYGASIFGNYNASSNLDMLLGYSGVWDSINGTDIDIAVHTVALGLNYLIMPEKSFTPYFGGSVGFANYSEELGGVRVSETDVAFTAQLGGEWGMTESTLLDVSAFYGYVDTEFPNNNGEYGVDVSVGVTPVEDLVLFVSGKYIFEDETAVFSLGAMIQL